MAIPITALINLRSKLLYGRPLQLSELAERIASRCGVAARALERMLKMVQVALTDDGHDGMAARPQGIGRVQPAIDRQCRIWARRGPALILVRTLGSRGTYRGAFQNRAGIGPAGTGLKLPWGAERPRDPLDRPLRRAS